MASSVLGRQLEVAEIAMVDAWFEQGIPRSLIETALADGVRSTIYRLKWVDMRLGESVEGHLHQHPGWSWEGLGGLVDNRVLVWGSASADGGDSPVPPDPHDAPLGWLMSQLDGLATVVDPIGGSSALQECEALGLRLVGRTRRVSPRLYDLEAGFEVSSCHKHSGVWQAAVLEMLSRGKGIKLAAELCGVHPSTVYKAVYRDESFARAVDLARGLC